MPKHTLVVKAGDTAFVTKAVWKMGKSGRSLLTDVWVPLGGGGSPLHMPRTDFSFIAKMRKELGERPQYQAPTAGGGFNLAPITFQAAAEPRYAERPDITRPREVSEAPVFSAALQQQMQNQARQQAAQQSSSAMQQALARQASGGIGAASPLAVALQSRMGYMGRAAGESQAQQMSQQAAMANAEQVLRAQVANQRAAIGYGGIQEALYGRDIGRFGVEAARQQSQMQAQLAMQRMRLQAQEAAERGALGRYQAELQAYSAQQRLMPTLLSMSMSGQRVG